MEVGVGEMGVQVTVGVLLAGRKGVQLGGGVLLGMGVCVEGCVAVEDGPGVGVMVAEKGGVALGLGVGVGGWGVSVHASQPTQ